MALLDGALGAFAHRACHAERRARAGSDVLRESASVQAKGVYFL